MSAPWDAQGYACSQVVRLSAEIAVVICSSHSGQCEFCGITFCVSCLYHSIAPSTGGSSHQQDGCGEAVTRYHMFDQSLSSLARELEFGAGTGRRPPRAL
jgi:hypothetical protein